MGSVGANPVALSELGVASLGRAGGIQARGLAAPLPAYIVCDEASAPPVVVEPAPVDAVWVGAALADAAARSASTTRMKLSTKAGKTGAQAFFTAS